MQFLLDTCTLLWTALEPDKLSPLAKKALTDLHSEFYFSPLSLGEIACAVQRKRITLKQHWKPWFQTCIKNSSWTMVPIDLRIVEEAYSLPENFHSDPADRIIVATARLNNFTIITGDKKILNYPHCSSLWD